MLDLPHPFGRYVLTRQIGEGGMAEVFKASVQVAEGLSKWVVIKKIRPEFATRREFTLMFVDEAKIALGLNHPNIVQVFDFGQIGDDLFLAMELIEGLDLMRLFHAVGAMSSAFPAVIAAYIGHQVASGLSYAHRRVDEHGRPMGIVHRDVSPHNIMLSYEGGVKVLDFGIARARPEVPAADVEEEHTIKGKIAYMSPEQANGRAVDGRSDVYSLGVVLYELLTGELQFRGRNRLAALERVRSQPLPPVLDAAPEVPYELAQIVDRALKRHPDERFQSAREMRSALAKFLHHSDPVVDDEVLADFVSRFREDGVRRRSPLGLDARTRELTDADSEVQPATTRRAQRLVLAQLQLSWANDDGGEADALTRRRVADFIRDVAFKREAQILESDEHGALMAFGAAFSTGDDAERSLRVARSLRESLGEFAPQVGLGVVLATAQVVVEQPPGAVPAVELPDGLGTHLSAVARRVIDQDVLVAVELAGRLSSRWRFGPATATKPQIPARHAGLPWAADLQQVMSLRGALSEAERRDRAGRGTRALLGREFELKRLRDRFAEAIRGHTSHGALVIGARGMGKRALMRRFVASLPTGACAVLRGRGRWAKRNLPMGTFLAMISDHLALSETTTRRDLVVLLREYQIEEARALAEAFAVALSLPAEPGAPDIRLDPQEFRDRLARLVRRLIRSIAATRPVLIIVEDLHYVDAASAELLRQFVARPMGLPVMGVATARPGPRVTEFRQHLVRASPSTTIIELQELDERARRELIVHRFEDPDDAEALADRILDRTGGNPLFIEETIDSLIRAGTIGWNAQARYLVVRDRNAPLELPPSVEDALRDRIEELSPDRREVLQAAAVLGSEFDETELEAIVGAPRADVRAQLDRLAELGLLRHSPDSDRWRFAIVSLHEVSRTGLPVAVAKELHHRAASVKRARPGHVPGRDDGPIAEHLIAAGRPTEAAEYALRAAEAARDVAGNVSAYFHLSNAIKCLDPGDPRRFEALLARAAILGTWGRRRAQGADIRQLIEEAKYAEDEEPDVIASMRLLRFYLECGRIGRAVRLAPRLARRIDSLAEPEPFRAVLGELESETAFARGVLDDAEAHARDALPYCWDDERGVRQRFRLLSQIGKVQLQTGRSDQASETFQDALSLARSIDNRRLEAHARTRLGEAAGRLTRYQESVEHFQAALAIDRDLGDRVDTGLRLAYLGMAYSAIGLYRRAERYLRKALELHEAIGHPGLLNDAMVSLGEVVNALGDPETACELLEAAVDTARTRDDVRTELRAEVHRARALASIGDPDRSREARMIAESVVERGRAGGYRTSVARALHVLAGLAQADDNLYRAIALERDALKLIRAGAAPMDGVLSIYSLGVLVRDRGQEEEGRALIREAAQRVRTRLESLTDEQLRDGYERQPMVQRILADGKALDPDPGSSPEPSGPRVADVRAASDPIGEGSAGATPAPEPRRKEADDSTPPDGSVLSGADADPPG
jgi:serine/threonine protein kinase/tetratricopeptide (TPR) repeat protein